MISHEQVEKFTNIANRFMNTVFIIAHMIGSDWMRGKLENKNIFFDLSAPQLYSVDIMKKTIDVYGAEKLLLGSDTPYGNHNIGKVIQRLKQLKLSEDNIALICGENIKNLLML